MRQLKKFFKLLSFDGIAGGEHRYSVIHQVKYALELIIIIISNPTTKHNRKMSHPLTHQR